MVDCERPAWPSRCNLWAPSERAARPPTSFQLPGPPGLQAKEGTNLLSGKNSTHDAPVDFYSQHNETVIVSYLQPNITIAMVDDFA